jgi:signal transduction histidine kinase
MIPIVVITSTLVVSIIAALFAQAQVERATNDLVAAKKDKLEVTASLLELRLEDATRILELAAKEDAMTDPLEAGYAIEQYKGIPPDLDLDRRQVVRNVLDVYEDFETAGFLLPNGDIYFVEPYAAQQNLPITNFAFREFFQVVTATQSPYIGEAVISAATGHTTVPVAVPVHSADGSFVGILASGLDLGSIQKKLNKSSFGTNEYVLITDHKGNKVADSREPSIGSELESIKHFGGIQKALTGESGFYTETIGNVKMFSYYHTVFVGAQKWAIISFQPYEDTFRTVNTISYQSLVTMVSASAVTAVSGLFLYRAFQSNSSLARRLEKVNDDLKSQAEKLREVDKEKEEFAAMITHELKTPLVPLTGYSELLLDGTLGELTERQKEKIQIMNDSANSLLRLISDLLDVRKLELGQMKFNFENVSAKRIVEECVNAIKPLVERKGIALDYNMHGETNLRCDMKRIQQVLYNLLTNAIKFVPERTGKIQVLVSRNGNGIDESMLFVVKDNGVGIAKEKQQNLFKKFYQADTSLSRNAGGTGLGLAISKGIVEAHNGKIWFESEPGVGSTFYFSIPSTISARYQGK